MRAGFSGNLQLRAGVGPAGKTILAAQAFRAPFHISKPYWDLDTRTLLVQVVNPTAGILAGDRLESEIAVDAGAALLVTTPSASRVFKMRDGSASFRQRFQVKAGGWLEVMPEALVPHRGCVYTQTTEISVEEGGEMFFADILVPGRIAHGEAWEWESLALEMRVEFAGELVLRERFVPSGAELRRLAMLAGSGDATAFANAVLIAADSPGDEVWLQRVADLHASDVWVGVSRLRRGGWTIKLVAHTNLRLRVALRELRTILAVRFPHLQCSVRKL